MGKNTRVVAISFSPPQILKLAKQRAKEMGFRHSFSAYVSKLVQNDLEEAGYYEEELPVFDLNPRPKTTPEDIKNMIEASKALNETAPPYRVSSEPTAPVTTPAKPLPPAGYPKPARKPRGSRGHIE